MLTERIPYKACPLCGAPEWKELHTTPMQRDAVVAELNLEPTITWRECDSCGHIYTGGYWHPEILQKICEASAGMPAEVCVDRFAWGRIVEMLVPEASYWQGKPSKRWLDVGCGMGTGIGTVAEYGFDVVGLELRPAFVDLLRKCGYNVVYTAFEEFTEAGTDGFDVILLAEYLEHTVRPVDSLKHAKSMLRSGGKVYASCPSRDSFPWRLRDAIESGETMFQIEGSASPCAAGRYAEQGQRSAGPRQAVSTGQWGQVEHYHAFDREHLELAFRKAGLRPQEFHVGRRYFETIEVIGR